MPDGPMATDLDLPDDRALLHLDTGGVRVPGATLSFAAGLTAGVAAPHQRIRWELLDQHAVLDRAEATVGAISSGSRRAWNATPAGRAAATTSRRRRATGVLRGSRDRRAVVAGRPAGGGRRAKHSGTALRVTVLIVLAAAFAGCGTSEKERVRATLTAERHALERQDWNTVCDLRTAAGRREFLRTSLRPDAKTCAEAWTPAPGGNEPVVTFEFRQAKRRLADIEVDKDVAGARYDDGFVQRLRKAGGRWRIDADVSR